jgi:hypothetical protein
VNAWASGFSFGNQRGVSIPYIRSSVATGEAYRDKITAAGSQAELIIYQDKKHGFFNRRRSEESFTDTVLKSHDFLNKVKFLP